MATGQIYQLQQPKSGLQEFTEAATPYLQMAYQQYMQRKQDEYRRKQSIQQAQTMFPEAFTSTLNQAGQSKYNMDIVSPGMRQEALGQVMPSIPEQYKQTAFNPETAPAGFKMQFGESGIPQFGYEKPDTLKYKREDRIINNQEKTRANQLRQEFINRPEIKEFTTIKNKVSAMDALLNSGKLGETNLAKDQGLITLFNKITDPNSVVRESEYERTPTNLSLANRFSGAFEKFKKGGAGITEEDRQALVFGAKVIANELGKSYNERLSQYSDIATSYGVEPGLVTTGTEQFTPYSFGEQQPQENQIISGWSQDKESRLQELLRKRGK